MEERKFIESFNNAVEGFIFALKTQRNMRIHFLLAVFFILLGIYLNFDGIEISVLVITITLVLVTEMINTAVELMVNVMTSHFHPAARMIKDVSAGAVLVASINAAIVGYVLFLKRIPFNIETAMANIRHSPWHITFISIVLVFAASIIGKTLFHKGSPLRGGMPSGHAAVAFSIWIIIAFLTNNSIVIVLTFVMAFLIARHRIKDAVHTFWEVLAGSILGILLTTLVFQLFR